MKTTSRWNIICLAAMPACAALAIDPTLPRPGGTPRATPAVAPMTGSSQGSTGSPAAPAPSSDASQVNAVPANRVAVPDAKALAEAQKLVEQVYKAELAAARTVDQKKQLAVKFRSLAGETKGDPAGQYVLLMRGRELAGDAGDAETALGSAVDLERAFELDTSGLELDAITRLQKTLRSTEAFKLLTRHLLGSTNQAVAADRFEAARKLIDQSVLLSARANDSSLAKLVAARAKDVREIEAAYVLAKSALDAVAKAATDPKTPADAEQSLKAGRYQAFYKNEFAAGLPLIAAGSDVPLKELATREIAGATSADHQNALGDAWYEVADKLTGVSRNIAMLHASRFYAQAEPTLAGLQKAKAIKRVKEAEPLAAMYVGRPLSTGGSAVASTTTVKPVMPATTAADITPGTNNTPATTADPPVPAVAINLPSKFVRIWKTPELWQNRPEQVTLKGNRVSIMNDGGVVCENEPLLPQKDGSLVLAWNYGPEKTGYEIWTIKGGELSIERWNNKAELDAGRIVRRTGTMAGK